MIAVTTPTLEGKPIKRYYGIVSGETFAGVNLFKDIGAGLSNLFGGRSSSYEDVPACEGNGCERGSRRACRLLHRRS